MLFEVEFKDNDIDHMSIKDVYSATCILERTIFGTYKLTKSRYADEPKTIIIKHVYKKKRNKQ